MYAMRAARPERLLWHCAWRGRRLTMRWPFKRRRGGELLIVSWFDQALAFVRAHANGDGTFVIRSFGVENQGTDSLADLALRLEARGLRDLPAIVMLRPAQYQWLQIDAPGVATEELRSAARYQIRDMINVHVDDVTLDVMRVGDGQAKGASHLFVVAAPNATLESVMELGAAMRWDVSIVDVQETAQRNLQNALAMRAGGLQHATAALVLADASQAVLTICADGEIFYARRLEMPAGFLDGAWRGAALVRAPVADGYSPVEEYVPDHGATSAIYVGDLPPSRDGPMPSDPDRSDDERAQRFLVEVQRSLDVWDRTWSTKPLAAVQVFAGDHGGEMAQWLTRELGQTVVSMDVGAFFSGFAAGSESDRTTCWPLLGLLLRPASGRS